MSDLVSVVATATSALTIAAVYKEAKPFLAKILGPAADEVGELLRDPIKSFRARLTAERLADANTMLAKTGRNPQAVEFKTLVPLVEAASLETDPSLGQRWAALLANAADPAQRVNVTAGFVEVLRQLSPADAQLLELLYKHVRQNDQDTLTWEPAPIQTKEFGEKLGLSARQFAVSTDTLIRLRLCALPTPNPTRRDVAFASGTPVPAATFQLCPTVFGQEFVQACTPPVD
jgi:hypothetical protein